MGERQCVAILGGGIRGASIAGMLAATGNFDVVVVERQEVAAGTTSTNHGRFHSGTWNYTENNEIIVRRNQDSCCLLRMLPDVIASNDTGYYFIESVEAIEPFKQFCHKHSIPITQHLPTDVNCDWIEPQIYTAVFDIPEFSFNPARLAARFIKFAENIDRCRILFGRASSICKHGNNYQINLEDDQVIEADIVINTLGRWIKDLKCDEFNLPLHDQSLIWERWRLLCIRCHEINIPRLDRVVTIECKNNKSLAAIPQGDWIIFGCDVKRDKLSSPEDTPIENIWRNYNGGEENDRQMLDLLAPYFPRLEEIIREQPQHAFTFSGVYPTVVGNESLGSLPVAYPVMQIHTNEEVPGYYLVFGGSATTSLIDAAEVTHRLIKDFNLPRIDESELLQKAIAPNFPGLDLGEGMIWEQRVGRFGNTENTTP